MPKTELQANEKRTVVEELIRVSPDIPEASEASFVVRVHRGSAIKVRIYGRIAETRRDAGAEESALASL